MEDVFRKPQYPPVSCRQCPPPSRPSETGPRSRRCARVAVLLVVLYHLWPGRLPGGYIGVDVFFVISGFLITCAPAARDRATGTVALRGFWARRARRLLPAASLVLVVTAVGVPPCCPCRRGSHTGEIIASTLYVQNWVLAADSVDYLAADPALAAASTTGPWRSRSSSTWSGRCSSSRRPCGPASLLVADPRDLARDRHPHRGLAGVLHLDHPGQPAGGLLRHPGPRLAVRCGWPARPLRGGPGRARAPASRCRPVVAHRSAHRGLLGRVRGARLVRVHLRRDHAVPGHGRDPARRGDRRDHRGGEPLGRLSPAP